MLAGRLFHTRGPATTKLRLPSKVNTVYSKWRIQLRGLCCVAVRQQRYNNLLNKLNIKRDKIAGMQSALTTADLNKDRRIDFEEWRHDLKM